MSEQLIRAIVCRVGQPAVVEMVEPSHDVLSALVGGYIEVAYVSPRIALVVNEEGAIRDLPFNRDVPALAPPLPSWLEGATVISGDPELLPPGSGLVGVHRVHGDFLLCGPDLTSLPEDLARGFCDALNAAG